MRKFAREHTLFTLIVCGLIIGTWAKSWGAGLLITATLGTVWLVAAWITTVDRDHHAKVERIQRLDRDATTQNQQWLAGDPDGLHGHYPPAT